MATKSGPSPATPVLTSPLYTFPVAKSYFYNLNYPIMIFLLIHHMIFRNEGYYHNSVPVMLEALISTYMLLCKKCGGKEGTFPVLVVKQITKPTYRTPLLPVPVET
jgi:hypothetical protein